MSKSLRLSEKWFNRGLWLVAFIFAGFLIKMRVKPRPSGRGRKARSDIENVAAMAD